MPQAQRPRGSSCLMESKSRNRSAPHGGQVASTHALGGAKLGRNRSNYSSLNFIRVRGHCFGDDPPTGAEPHQRSTSNEYPQVCISPSECLATDPLYPDESPMRRALVTLAGATNPGSEKAAHMASTLDLKVRPIGPHPRRSLFIGLTAR